jgi:Putative adhesin
MAGALATALVSAGCGPGQPSATSGQSSSSSGSTSAEGYHTEQTTYQITQPVSRLRLDGRAGRVAVTAADGPISVTEAYVYSDDKPPTSHDVSGDILTLRADDCPHQRPVNGRCEVDWDIKAPAATILDLTNRAGGIAVTGSAAELTMQTNAGGIRGRALTSKSVTATSNAGGLDLQFAQPPDQLQATSNAGGIDIQVPAGTSYAVTAKSSTGHPNIDVQQSQSAGHKIDARTNAGGIDISNG